MAMHWSEAGHSVAGKTFDELGGPDSILVRQRLDHAVLDRDRADELTADVESKHQEINDLLVQIDGASDDARTRAAVDRVCALIRADAREEEDVLLPRLLAELDPDALRRLGSAWQAARVAAPIRPHPRVSRRPPGNAVAGPFLAVWDRLRGAVAPRVRRRFGRFSH
ncbi:hypothetical protein [Sporichthya polymorpha]|uniref:hypothetical protein n=1 Tax=Sporichthya polymorpha TaxID=35751 RepID=UPI0003633E65|nr:hypothetical protein [Sporichthya polymorpha]